MPEEIHPTAAPAAPKPTRIIGNDPRTAIMGGQRPGMAGATTGSDTSGVPSERLDLPSRGLLYPKGHPAASGFIMVRPITTAEEEILATERFAKQGITIELVLQRCITTRGLDTLSLLNGDRTHILFYLRAISYGPDYTFTANLKGNLTQEVKTNVSKLQIRTMPDGFVEPALIQVDGTNYEVVLMRGADEHAVTQARLARKRTNPEAADIGVSLSLCRQIRSVNGEQDPEFINKHVRSMVARHASKLRAEILKITPGPVLRQTVVRQDNGEQEDVVIQITESFFRADAEPDVSVGDEGVAGQADLCADDGRRSDPH